VAACELGSEIEGQLGRLAEADHLGLLLGAGASVAAGLPSWDELALRLLRHAGAIGDADTARAYLASQDPTLAAEAARATAQDWHGVMHTALYGDPVAELYPGSLHLAAAYLAASGPQRVALLTLNIDDVLEEALGDVLSDLDRNEGVFARTAATPRAREGAHEVQHLHGLLPRDRSLPPQDVVLTLSDFNRLTSTAHPWQAGALGDVLSRGPLVLAGTTFRDADVRQWLHASQDQRRDTGHGVTAVVARHGLGLSGQQFADVREAVQQQWSAVGADTLLVQDHADAAQLLREVAAVGSSGYELPKARARAFFDRHVEAFSELQAHYAVLLDADLETLPAGRDPDSDLTLWLADGSNELIRWASHDRTYRSPDKLRRVHLGYDSLWTAARAVSLNEVLIDATTPNQGTGRWRTVLAAPVTVSLPGGPDLVLGAVSVGTTSAIRGRSELAWRTTMADLAESWSQRVL
jgi:hypothetical protein